MLTLNVFDKMDAFFELYFMIFKLLQHFSKNKLLNVENYYHKRKDIQKVDAYAMEGNVPSLGPILCEHKWPLAPKQRETKIE